MNIFVSGISYKSTPLEIREKFNYNLGEIKRLINIIKKGNENLECVMISTCNRTEIYIYTENQEFDTTCIEKILCDFKDINLYEYKRFFYTYYGKKAVKHLFKVTCGLDSMILGEDQILGQIKKAVELSMKEKVSGPILNKLFKDSITGAKYIKTKTLLSKLTVSISSLAVNFLADIYKNDIKSKNVMVIGGGEISEIVVKNLFSLNIKNIYIAVRSKEKINHLGKMCKWISYKKRYNLINWSDIIISATSSPHYTLTKDLMDENLIKGKEICILDLAVPRDVDYEISKIDKIKYFNIDHFNEISNKNNTIKKEEAVKASDYIDEFIYEFERWYEFRKYVPMLKDIQYYIDNVIEKNAKNTSKKMNIKDTIDEELIKTGIKSAVKEIFVKFVYNIKESGSKNDIEKYFSSMSEFIKDIK